MQDHNQSPLNPLPWIVWAVALPIIALELVLVLADYGIIGGPEGVGWRLDALLRFAYSAPLMREMVEVGSYPAEQMLRLLTYPFVYESTTQALFALVILLALGKMVAEVFSTWAFLTLFFASSVGAALALTLFLPGVHNALIGGFPAVYGLIGAYTFLMWKGLGAQGAGQSRAFRLIGVLLGVQILFSIIFGGDALWVADAFGFVIGFGLSFVLRPGGGRALRERLRR